MKNIIKAYLIYICSGWRDINIFGMPKIPKDRKFITVLVTYGDGTMMDICQPIKYNKKSEWQQGGIFTEMLPNYVNVKYWKSIKRISWWSHFALTNK